MGFTEAVENLNDRTLLLLAEKAFGTDMKYVARITAQAQTNPTEAINPFTTIAHYHTQEAIRLQGISSETVGADPISPIEKAVAALDAVQQKLDIALHQSAAIYYGGYGRGDTTGYFAALSVAPVLSLTAGVRLANQTLCELGIIPKP